MTIGYILWSFGTFFPVLVNCLQKNLATLQWRTEDLFEMSASVDTQIPYS
jgi:hypothetical protein